MKEKRIWFGNRRRMQWVKPWAPSPEHNLLAFNDLGEFTNGGASLHTSLDASGDYTFEWTGASPDVLEFVHAYARGRYGRELMYWTDPLYAHRNLLPPRWATPWIAADDAIPLIRRARPTTTDNADFSREYPAHGARYSVQAGDESATLLLPIPPGYTLWLGVHGDADVDGKFIATPHEGLVAGTPVPLDRLAVDSTTRVNHSFAASGSSAAAQSWVELSIDTASTAAFTAVGLIAQIHKTGDTPPTGDFLEGMGHSGCDFHSLSPQPLTASFDRSAIVARFVEVGSWQAFS
jgi:hypothetical protein